MLQHVQLEWAGGRDGVRVRGREGEWREGSGGEGVGEGRSVDGRVVSELEAYYNCVLKICSMSKLKDRVGD